ncbi:hypothetical protein [Corynebacterium amycolatum]|uniref:hypothetical protein n=1 Tax=Corynebacterium amycolatum TaxID=43765 RepID=UPI00191E2BED|nr:hypothetical protein [Corynebacterium amycolatum]QQU97770.1 hypothetical protein I6I65_10635 [Corynebacterium amycolatum]
MTNIADLEKRINSAETVLDVLKAELEELKQQEQPEQESLFGRWATHPKYGRGIIIYDKPYPEDQVRLAHRIESEEGETAWPLVHLADLTLDPANLTTKQDFEDAPEDTIAEATTEPHDVYVKTGKLWYVAGDITEANPTTMPTCRVIRWGDGE